MPMKRTLPFLLITVLLAACGGKDTTNVGVKRAERDSLKTVYAELGVKIKELETWLAENDSTQKRNLTTVTAAAVAYGPFTHYVDVHGNAKADKAATLYALSGGRVRRIHVKPGQQVKKGDMLVSFDNDMVVKQIQQARTGLELARTAYEKQERLWQQKIGSEMQYLQAKSQKEQAEAGLGALEEQQRLSNVTAPFAGTVDDIMVRDGDMAAPGVPVARVVDLSGVQLEADVPESHLRSIRSGAPVLVTFPSIGGDTLKAKLDHVGSFIDPANRTFKVTVHVQEGSGVLRPNLLGNMSIQDSHSDSALVVPARAVLQDVQGNNYVYKLEPTKEGEAKAHKVMVRRVSEYRGNVHIEAIDPAMKLAGSRIVDEGAKNVTEGLTVRVAN